MTEINIRPVSVYLLIILAVSLIFNACKVGPDYLRTSPTLPANYNQPFPSDTSIANTPWWQLFGDTALVNLISEGLEENKELKLAAARIKEAGEAMGIVRSDLYPKINYGAGGSSTFVTGGSGFSHEYLGAVNVSYTLDVWAESGDWKKRLCRNTLLRKTLTGVCTLYLFRRLLLLI